jgi:hypothetical protein
VIDAAAILKVIVTLFGCWMLGYTAGVSVAFVRRILGAA